MDPSGQSTREQAVRALQEGRLDEAIDLLVHAVQADGDDADAQAFLGVAYSEKGLHPQAQEALQRAITLQPRNYRYRFNLGTARELAGDAPGAARAYRETLQLHPEHPQARARLQHLGTPAHTPRGTASHPGARSGSSPPEAPWERGAGTPADAPHPEHAGMVQCPHCGEWQRPGLSCEFCSASLQTSRAATRPVGPPEVAEPPERPYDPYVEDFDLGQALKDWFWVLVAPRAFFRGQAERGGLKAPLALFFLYGVAIFLSGALVWQMISRLLPRTPSGAGLIVVIVLLVSTVIAGAVTLAILFVWAGIVHLLCRLAHGRAGYEGSFRAATYAAGPYVLVWMSHSVLVFLAPGLIPYVTREFAWLQMVSFLYYLFLLGLGLYHIHRLSPWAAGGVVIFSGVMAIGLLFLSILGGAFMRGSRTSSLGVAPSSLIAATNPHR